MGDVYATDDETAIKLTLISCFAARLAPLKLASNILFPNLQIGLNDYPLLAYFPADELQGVP